MRGAWAGGTAPLRPPRWPSRPRGRRLLLLRAPSTSASAAPRGAPAAERRAGGEPTPPVLPWGNTGAALGSRGARKRGALRPRPKQAVHSSACGVAGIRLGEQLTSGFGFGLRSIPEGAGTHVNLCACHPWAEPQPSTRLAEGGARATVPARGFGLVNFGQHSFCWQRLPPPSLPPASAAGRVAGRARSGRRARACRRPRSARGRRRALLRSRAAGGRPCAHLCWAWRHEALLAGGGAGGGEWRKGAAWGRAAGGGEWRWTRSGRAREDGGRLRQRLKA